MPQDIDERGSERGVPEHMLPALLKATEKRVLDLLSDWPWLALGDLAGLLGVTNQRASQLTTALKGFGLAARVPSAERRLVLTDAGLTLLARRDRAAVGGAKKRWSAAPPDAGAAAGWRGVSGRRSRLLLRDMQHTASVHGFAEEQAARYGTARYAQDGGCAAIARPVIWTGKLAKVVVIAVPESYAAVLGPQMVASDMPGRRPVAAGPW